MANEVPLILHDCIFPSSIDWRISGLRDGLENAERVLGDLHSQWRRQQLRARVVLTFLHHAIDNVRYLEHRTPQYIEAPVATPAKKKPSKGKPATTTSTTTVDTKEPSSTTSSTTVLPSWHDTVLIDRFRGSQLIARPHQRSRRVASGALSHLPFNQRPLEADTTAKVARLTGKKKEQRAKVEKFSIQFRHLYTGEPAPSPSTSVPTSAVASEARIGSA
jgi:hypothetical protein